MDQANTTKKYPTSTSEVAKMLGIQAVEKDLPMGSFGHSPSDLPVANLPIVDSKHPSLHAEDAHAQAKTDDHGQAHAEDVHSDSTNEHPSKILTIVRIAGPFVAVFAIGIFLYYFFFSGVSFSGLLPSSAPKPVATQLSALQQLEASNLTSFQQWMQGYYYDITDPKLLDPEADNSGNGLTNFQKYLLNLNPKSYDTLGLGMADSQALAQGINPLTGSQITGDQKLVMDKYVDMEVTMNRLALNNSKNPGEVAGATIYANGNIYSHSTSTTGLNTRGPNSSQVTNVIGDGSVDINTDVPGRLEIPELKVNVPIIWSQNTQSFEKDLQSGVIHYPGTALPGQIGTTYIAGHSSNYIWAKGNFNEVFTHLDQLPNNASFKITVVQKNGKDAIFSYIVTKKVEYTPTDPAQFENGGQSVVVLSTCWPVGSTAKRLVVFGTLTQVSK